MFGTPTVETNTVGGMNTLRNEQIVELESTLIRASPYSHSGSPYTRTEDFAANAFFGDSTHGPQRLSAAFLTTSRRGFSWQAGMVRNAAAFLTAGDHPRQSGALSR